MKEQSAVLLSGGVDSAVAMAMLYDKTRGNKQHKRYGVFIDYGQYNCEGEAAASEAIANQYAASYRWLKVRGLYWQDLPMTEGDARLDTNWELSEVPFRNPILISMGAAFLQERGGGYLWTGIQPAPHWGTSYHDTSLAFLDTMSLTVREGSGEQVALVSPFIEPGFYSKTDIILAGETLEVPWEVTHSCFRLNRGQCGTCVTCVQRAGSFKKANVIDPRPIHQLA